MLIFSLFPALAVGQPHYSVQRAEPSEPEPVLGSKEKKQQAISRIPTGEIDPAWRERILEVASRAALFQQMSSQMIECEPEFYRFLVEHPEIVVAMWQNLGITKLKLQILGPKKYRLDDGAGTTAVVEYLYLSPNQHVVYSEGSYSGPLMLRPVEGRVLVVLTANYLRETAGTPYVSAQMDLYIQVDRIGAELITKALHPLLGGMAETNYQQTMAFVGSVYRTAVVRPQSLQRLANQLTQLDSTTREAFVAWIDRIGNGVGNDYDRAAMVAPIEEIHKRALQPETMIRE
ncbi:MAG: hypothetical protein ACUVQG_05175 [Thermogutta sp.]